MDSDLDLDLRKLASGFDLDLSSLTGFGFDLDLRGWRICTPLFAEDTGTEALPGDFPYDSHTIR